MAESDTGFLRSVELRLLRCTLPPLDPPPPSQLPSLHPPNSLRPLIESLLGSIERGDYAEALSSDAARLVFGFSESWEFTDSAECAAGFYHEVERSVGSFLSHETEAWIQTLDTDSDAELECRFALVMSIAVAALLAFTQQNVTGPVVDLEQFPLLFMQSTVWSQKVGKEWNMWAQKQLESVGSHLLGKFSHLQHLIFSKILLSKTKDLSNESNKSISWWLCRLILLQQRILDELSSSLFQLLQVLKNEALLQFGRLEKVCSYWGSLLYEGEGLLIVSVAQIEAGIIEYKYGRIDSSRLHLNSAEEACGMHLSVTGVLGFRTIHQVDAKSQMVLVTCKDQQSSACGRSAELSQAKSDSTRFEAKSGSFPHGHEDCDILITPRLVENGNTIGPNGDINDVAKNMMLTEIQQAVVLAQCLPLSRISREDELSRWEIAPFIEAIDAQHQSCHIIRSFSDILRIRWESTRSRTKQRAFLMMDKLVETISEPLPIAAQRIQFSFIVHVPTIPALRKEYGELSVSCGMIPEALKIFEDLELWDNLIYCYRLLEKKPAAVDLIKSRLCHTPTDPRLWCSLGDVANNDCYYEKALEVSNNKSARAKRSLARSAYNRGDYATSKILWESAMALNSLYPDGWFALGAAALKDRDIDKALDGFTRAVQLDPDNGEAWNNIACLHVVKKKSKPAFIAFKEALKFRRNSWQIWEGYSHVAFDIGNFQQALEATKMVLDLSSNKRVDVDLLDKLMSEVEDRTCKSGLSSFNDIGCQNDCTPQANFSHLSTPSSAESGYLESTSERSRETELLVDVLGNVLKQVIRNSAGENIWGLYARWHKIKGNLIMCSEALLKQVRSYQGSDLWHDRDRFKKFAHASLQLCKVYIEIASSGGSHRELIMAEMHLKNSVKQAVNFSDTEEFKDLQSCLDEIKERLHTTSIKAA